MGFLTNLPVWALLAGFWAATGLFISLLVLLRIRKVAVKGDQPSLLSAVSGSLVALIAWPLLVRQLVNDALPFGEDIGAL